MWRWNNWLRRNANFSRLVGSALPSEFRQTPVHHQGFAVLAEHNIPRFQVAVQHTPTVRALHGLTDVDKTAKEHAQAKVPLTGIPLCRILLVVPLDGLFKTISATNRIA